MTKQNENTKFIESGEDLKILEVSEELKESVRLKESVKSIKRTNLSKNQTPIKLNFEGVYDEYANLPNTIQEAYDAKRDLTLKQITMIMGLHGLFGETFNVIHDNIQKKVYKRVVKIKYSSRYFLVSFYNWYNLPLIENMIWKMLDTY